MVQRWKCDVSNSQVGLTVRLLRFQRHGICRPRLARDVKVTELHLYYIEIGQKRPSLPLVRRICKYFRISIKQFEKLARCMEGIDPKAMLVLELEREAKKFKRNRRIRYGVRELQTIMRRAT